MKYLVMECHEGYAVLMGEDSSFVTAANMHYEVGQTVTDPVLLDNGEGKKPGRTRIIMRAVRVGAVAACLVLAGFTGYQFFRPEKVTVHTVVFVSNAAEIKMELDDNGSVVRLTSDSERGNQIIDKYIESHGSTSDRVDTANDLLELQIEDGYISSGDTVDVIIPADSSYETYKTEFKDNIGKLDLNVNVRRANEGRPVHEPPKAPEAPSAPVPPHEDKNGDTHNTEAVQPPSAPEAPIAPEAPSAPESPAAPGETETAPGTPTPPGHHERPDAGQDHRRDNAETPDPSPALPGALLPVLPRIEAALPEEAEPAAPGMNEPIVHEEPAENVTPDAAEPAAPGAENERGELPNGEFLPHITPHAMFDSQ